MSTIKRGRITGWLALLIATATCSTAIVSSHSSVGAVDPPHRLAFGAYTLPRSGQTPQQAVTQLETQIGRKLEVVRVFKLWGDTFPDSFDQFLKAGGRTPIMSVKPTRGGSIVTWSAIANAAPGSQVDTEIRSWARRVRDFGAPIYIALHHEPETSGDTRYGTVNDFIAAWRHWVDVFRQEGATNARFMWIMTDYGMEVASSDRRYGPKWYPGDDWVDAMAIDAYNWHECRQNQDIPWRSLATIIEPFRKFGLLHPTKKMWLAEWGTWEDPAVAGRKGQWFDEAHALFAGPNYAQFAGVSYFNWSSTSGQFANCVWRVDSTASSLARFAAMANDPLYSGDAFGDPPPPAAPLAAFTQVCTDLSCTFTDGSSDSDGNIVSRSWDFDDTNTSTETSPTHSFAGADTYTVSLTVTDNDGLTNTVTHDVQVQIAQPVAPVAAFTSVCTDLSCAFTDASTDSDGHINSWLWNFDDGFTSTQQSPEHDFTGEATYHVTLTVTDDDGQSTLIEHDVVVAIAPPVAPVAAFTPVCNDLSCTFVDGSTDSDGNVVSRLWDFDDNASTSTATSPAHTFGAARSYHVTLTVTDDDGLTNTAAQDVTVAVAPPGPVFHAVASANSSSAAASVAVPATVVLGDRLLMIVTANAAVTATTPAGWTLLSTQSDGTPDMRSWVFTRVAAANSAGTTVTSTLSASSRSSRVLLAYTNSGTPAVTSAVAGPSTTAHATPAATTSPGNAIVSYWSDKTDTATGWTLPVQVQSRATSIGTSTGRINAAVGDSKASGTSWAGASASSTAASNKAIMWTIVLPVNQPPTAAFSASCTGSTCTLTTASSTDADGTITAASWAFGDTTTGTGLSTTHTYAGPATYSVTVTVTDSGGATASTTHDVVVSPTAASPITFVGQATANANTNSHRVVAPTSVRAGDGLILAFTANTNATVGTPAGITGWRLLGTRSNGSMSTRIWTKVATAANAGAAVTVSTSAVSKGNFVIAVYRGTSATDPVATFASALETTSRTTHTTPAVQVTSDRSWVVWYWAHEDSSTTAFVAPAGTTVRSNTSQSGSGRITGLLADSNAAVGVGTTAGKTATAASANSNATMWAVVLAPA